jgi:hypothetical protein
MNEFHYSVSLSLQHPSMDPQEISTTLSQFPCERSTKAGEIKKSPNGKIRLPEERSEFTYWHSIDLHAERRVYSGVREFSDFLRIKLLQLKLHQEFFERFTDQGWAHFFVGWFSNSPCAAQLLGPDVLRMCGELGIGIELHVYGEGHG